MRLPDPERSRAVLIGTSRYTDPELPDLTVVRRTVADLAATLTDTAYGAVLPEHCTTLLDVGDIKQVGRALRTAARAAEDLLLVYYVGHGLIGAKRHELYLSLTDSEWAHPEFDSLEYSKLRDVVLDSPAASKVIILDNCFSGRALSGTMAAPQAVVAGQIEVAGTYVMASSPDDEVSLVLEGEDKTAFTGRLLRLLREGVNDGPALLSIEELYLRLQHIMRAEGLPEPLQRGSRNAALLALGRNRAHGRTAERARRARHAAAVALCEAGRYEEAAESLSALLAEQQDLLGADHEETLRSRQWLAHSLGGAGAPAESAGTLREIHALQVTVLGADHPDTLRSRQFLAVNLGESGRRPEAIRLLRLLLIDRRRVLGPDDVHTLRTRHVLAHNLARAGEPDEAAARLRELAADRERILGADHPHTRRALSDLSALLGEVS
ncbi:caspase family protein [Streptomyces coffeae]|uniref:Caspase family protein n=1 Tax=Streptomyces coffeae TaxID=621382 RepID=A0ABS1NQA0_9ACTN|nr:tetratricopeptide repeat protein [Streptomyces coffeae]MBL1102243.1 caspase family protein [Streptomyces coffeae]